MVAATAELAPQAPLRDMREVRRRLDTRFGVLKAELDASGFLREWRDISDFISTNRGRYLVTETNRKRRTTRVVDPEGLLSARICASGMLDGLSSPSRPWFRLIPKDRLLLSSAPVRDYLHACERRMYQVFQASNFYQAIHQFYGELCTFGTGALIEFEDFEDIIRFETMTIGEYVLAQNARRFCDTLFREFEMTCSQMIEAGFKIPETLAVKYRANPASTRDEKHIVRHMVGPNHDRIVGRLDQRNMPFMSVYWLAGCEEADGGILQFKGFQENALIAGRWETTGNDTYGHCPGMTALEEVKQLQFESRAKAKGIEKSLDPPMQAPAALKNEIIDLLPGGITFHEDRPNTKGLTSVYGSWRPDIQAVNEDLRDIRRRVREIFYADLFFAISQMEGIQPKNEMELAERRAEKLIGLGPVVEGLRREVLDRVIDRTWRIMQRVPGFLPDPPDEIANTSIEVDYISPLAQAQKQVGLGNIERALGFLGNLSGAFPEAADKLKVDETVDEYFDRMALPPPMIRSADEVAKLRAARAQQQQIAQMAALAPALKDGAQAAELLARTDAGRPAPRPIGPY